MKTLSYQLYSSRNFGPLKDTLQMLADAGYTQVEGYGGIYGSVDEIATLSDELATAGLTMPSGHIGLDMVEDDSAAAIKIAQKLGMTHMFVPHLAQELRPDDMAGWKAFGARLQEAGKPLEAAGIRFGWHNHDFEFTPIDGAMPMEAILDGGPDLAFEFDVAWAARAGADAENWITQFADRIVAAHVKDIAEPGQKAEEDGWDDVGEGTMDWGSCLAKLDAAGCQIFVAEHDNPSDDKRFATRSFNNIQDM